MVPDFCEATLKLSLKLSLRCDRHPFFTGGHTTPVTILQLLNSAACAVHEVALT